ncbi:hypothetical protein COL26b_014494 [Colletotrichum chrysophilum]|uniref:uncharacterized protein n=1 Tax=Colletotrichum chrysophilum TaxID=1836956 RepID=UPI002301BDE0|nr:uncharacterized protein COL26b_014494 [Colletotrichum chrysophilum]KAJ0358407.1 hypothetical protein COL26b_014494 [Colletotrichum chrysophilum]
MEPVGLAVGVAGLAGLFSTCLEAVQRVASYKNYGRDSRSLAAQFDADKHRLEQWGQAVGIKDGKLSDTHHPALDDAQKLSIVHKLLVSIQGFGSGADDTIDQRPALADGEFPKNKLVSTRLARPRQSAPTDSKLRRVAWALHGKAKRTEHVQTFATLMLWINGPAGFGKTVLCAKLVEVLSSSLQTPVAHFFLSSTFEGRDDPFMAIRSWIAQVLLQSQAALEVVHKSRLAQHEQGTTRATIIKLFREVLQAVPSCTFVLDGLDECTCVEETRNSGTSMVRFLGELRQAVTDTTARILVVSRSEPEIRQGLTQYPGFSEYTISPEDVHTDNISYSRSIVNNKLPNKDEPTRLSISQKMADRYNGQFQWLKMQENFLRKGRNKKQLEKDIDETPAGLDHLYDRNWEFKLLTKAPLYDGWGSTSTEDSLLEFM